MFIALKPFEFHKVLFSCQQFWNHKCV